MKRSKILKELQECVELYIDLENESESGSRYYKGVYNGKAEAYKHCVWLLEQ